MKIGKNLIFYSLVVLVFGFMIYLTVKYGRQLEAKTISSLVSDPATPDTPLEVLIHAFIHNITHPLAILILQIISIILTARICGYIFHKLGQPTVIGEIIAGIILGPSLLGFFLPDLSLFLFPASSLANLQFLSQVGLILFMFVIGMELDLKLLQNKAHEAVVISHASIIIPYALGMMLAYYLYTAFAPPGVRFISFALFMGIAMSITAFPVLARVIQERGLTKTRLGALAITCAATDDITAWCILAAVIAIVKAGSIYSALYTIAFSLVYVLLMIYMVQPFLKRLGSIYFNRETISRPIVALVFVILLISSYTTEIIGIHALFGAFLAGVVMPASRNFRKIIIEKIEDVSLVLLLPLFFVFTGLRTQIGLLTEGHLWTTCGLVILVAIAGKFGGSALAARFVGQSWKDSLSIGALMNTRGLMELIVLNIGYDLGVLSPQMFAMLVLMALVTTFMTGPALDLINWFTRDKSFSRDSVSNIDRTYRILISFGPAHSGKKLLRLASQMDIREDKKLHITALHLTPSADVNPLNVADFEKESFTPIRAEAEALNIGVETIYKATNDVTREIVQLTTQRNFDFLLVGAEKSLFRGTFLGNLMGVTRVLNPENLIGTIVKNKKLFAQDDFVDERSKNFFEETNCSVGVFIDKDFKKAHNILLTLFTPEDVYLLSYAQRFIRNIQSEVMVFDAGNVMQSDTHVRNDIEALMLEKPLHIKLLKESLTREVLENQDLMLISHTTWENFTEQKVQWLEDIPSTLIIKP